MSNMTMQFSQQTRKLFIQMSGAPGSGKSTTANPLAKLINGVVVDHDILKSALLEKGVSFDKAAEIAYHLNWTFAEALIKQDHSVIVDSTCNYEQILSQGIALAQRYGYEYWYVEVKADNVGMLDERLRERVPLRSQRKACIVPRAMRAAPEAAKTLTHYSRGGSRIRVVQMAMISAPLL